jgi:hypothetical protein
MNKRKRFLIRITVAAAMLAITGVIVFLMMNSSKPRTNVAALMPADADIPAAEYKPVNNTSKLPGYATAAENDTLALLVNEDTADIVVYDKNHDYIWRSVPQDSNKDPRAVTTGQKNLQSSHVVVHYYNNINNRLYYGSQADSIERNQYKIQSITNGVRITYTFGQSGPLTGIIPWYITEERLNDKILSHLTDKEVRMVRRRYVVSKSKPGFLELVGQTRTSVLQIKELLEILYKVGYTEEDYIADNLAAGIVIEKSKTSIVLPVDYYLNDEGFVVSSDLSKAEEGSEVFLYRVDLLRNFGGASIGEEGYMLVPNGGGALINLNNGVSDNEYIQYVYGLDKAQMTMLHSTVQSDPVLPVFGLKSGDSAWFAEITDGEALAGINASVSGRLTSYNNVFAFFTVRYNDTLAAYGDSGLGAEMLILPDDFTKRRISVTYSFLYGDEADYSGMASEYRSKLIDRGVLTKKEDTGNIPFYLDVIGSIVRKKHFLTIPVDSVFPMTTFREGADMVSQLARMGVSNINVRLQGWFNKGYFHQIPKEVKIDRILGSKKDLNAFVDAVEGTGGKLFPDTAMMQAKLGNNRGYSPSNESSRYLAGYTMVDGIVNRPTMRIGMGSSTQQFWYYVSPGRLPEHVNAFIDSYDEYGINAVSLRDLGDTLYSDMRRGAIYDRDYAESIVIEQFEKIRAKYDHIMIEGGNLYALKYVTDVVDAHLSANKYLIIDEEVPFFQMVLHGYIDYSGTAINIDDTMDFKNSLLQSIEYAASPHFVLTAKSTSYLKSTAFNFLYSTEFSVWRDSCAQAYAEINSVLKDLNGVEMAEHIIHSKSLREMRYIDGTSVFVNYGSEEVEVDGVVIPPSGYVTIKNSRRLVRSDE